MTTNSPLDPEQERARRRANGRKAVLISTSIVGGLALLGSAAATPAIFSSPFGSSATVIGPSDFLSWLTSGDADRISFEDFVNDSDSGPWGGSEGEEFFDRDDFPWNDDEHEDSQSSDGASGSSGASTTQTASASGITSIDIEVVRHMLDIEYGDVSEAELRATGAASDSWRLEREGDALVVESPEGGRFSGRTQATTLVLPTGLKEKRIDADIDVSTGVVNADLRLDSLELEVGAGAANIGGSADTVEASVSAGELNLDLDRVSDASLSVELGELSAAFSGSAPDSLGVEVGAGNMQIELPDETYRLDVDADFGNVNAGVTTAADAPNVISGSVDLGSLRLQAEN